VSSVILILKISITFSSLVISQTLFGVPSGLNAARPGLTAVGRTQSPGCLGIIIAAPYFVWLLDLCLLLLFIVFGGRETIGCLAGNPKTLAVFSRISSSGLGQE